MTTVSSTTRKSLLSTLTFPRTRALATDLWQRRVFRVAFWYALSLIVIAPYALLRGVADNAGMPVHGPELETALFGGLPTLWLQEHAYSRAPAILEALAVVVHISWFFVPLLVSGLVVIKSPDRIGSFFRWWILLEATALIIFMLIPMQPPWMTEPEVVRVIALRHGGEIFDPNPVAAMPSLHVAFPLLLALWFYREKWNAPGHFLVAYAALIGIEVVFSGEHYVIDVLGAVIFAAAVSRIASTDWITLGRRVQTRMMTAVPEPRRPAAGPAPSSVRSQRAQTLIEFAFVLPIILVFFFSLVDFGIAIDKRVALQHAVREGARYAAVHEDVQDICNYTADQAQTIIDPDNVTVSYPDGTSSAGDRVNVQADFTWDFPIMSEILGAFGVSSLSIDMTPNGTSRLEKSVAGGGPCT